MGRIPARIGSVRDAHRCSRILDQTATERGGPASPSRRYVLAPAAASFDRNVTRARRSRAGRDPLVMSNRTPSFRGHAVGAEGSVGSMVRDVPIRGQMIKLGQLLKLASVIASGAEVKAFLATQEVWVNEEREARRGRQLHPGDVVRVNEHELRLTSTAPAAP
jgi:ribosome-associated protein